MKLSHNRRVVYGDGWSANAFKWGVHVKIRRHRQYWQQVRVAFGAHHPRYVGTRVIDFSVRETLTSGAKPMRPAWRVMVIVHVGRIPVLKGRKPRGYPGYDTDRGAR